MYEEASQVANDAVSSIRTVASFCAEQKVMDLYKKKCEAPAKHGVRQGIISGVGFGLSNFVLFCTYALVFYVGARFVEDGKANFSQVFKVRNKFMYFHIYIYIFINTSIFFLLVLTYTNLLVVNVIRYRFFLP